MMPAFIIDLMELADIGGQPRNLAREIHRQIKSQLIETPLPVPLEQIAKALGIKEITEHNGKSFEGTLVVVPDRSSGIISIRSEMPLGRRNFTLGHEIGHFANPYHCPPAGGFRCDTRGMRVQRGVGGEFAARPRYDQMEVEANEFSAELNVPAEVYRRERLSLCGYDLQHVETLRKRFAVSKEMMAQIYVNTSPEPIAIITSSAGCVERIIRKPKFPYLGLKRRLSLPIRSLTARALSTKSPGHLSEPQHVSPDVWVENSRLCPTLQEQVLLQRGDRAMTLLRASKQEIEDRKEEIELARRWAEPRFTYGR